MNKIVNINRVVILITFFLLTFVSLVAMAGPEEESYVYPDEIVEVIREFYKSESSHVRGDIVWKFANSMEEGIIPPDDLGVICVLEDALYSERRIGTLDEALRAVSFTNVLSAKEPVENLLAHEDILKIAPHLKKRAESALASLFANQRTLNQFLKDFEAVRKGKNHAQILNRMAFDMVRFFRHEEISPHFRDILERPTIDFNELEHDKKQAILRAIALSNKDSEWRNTFKDDRYLTLCLEEAIKAWQKARWPRKQIVVKK